jgi:nitrate reductase gamma subunit
MESTRKNMAFWVNFVIFHIGAVTGIGFAVSSSLVPSFFQIPVVMNSLLALLATTFLIALWRVYRRFTNPVLRLVSSPDDYFAIMTLAVWLGLSLPAVAFAGGMHANEGFMVAFLFMTSFFLVYVPFSKISHYLYYPFTRYFLGKTLGHRGSMPAQSK